ncbi:hypothetical protein RISK_000212 [Rhodopirellula islandica]|uniref:Uncharacterized protein n=1 Tax=Rhodopirellula islandica TaxID=595434 RepID=A0A0J1BMH9_RHOIS|nr:hypothetical protein RISK_000212 [Rhodopirellula islandica]
MNAERPACSHLNFASDSCPPVEGSGSFQVQLFGGWPRARILVGLNRP